MYATLTETVAAGVRLITASGPGARIAFSDRNGGVSAAPFETLNLAITVGDERERVLENRSRVATAAGFDISRLVLAKQVHGADVIEATEADSGMLGEADVLVTAAPGTTLGIMTAPPTHG
jgi:copper oxidase (laccase) domain-containing protein